MNASYDVIVVGSGASAAQAAQTVVEAGRTVMMLDVGYEDPTYGTLIPQAPFAQLRRSDRGQHRYLLGDEFEGVPLGALGTGPQVTPPRQYVVRHVDALTPTRAPDFVALESLALGGLGGAWGAVCFPFLEHELAQCGLPAAEMRGHYEVIARRVGISGDHDDLELLRGRIEPLQAPLEIDANAARILARYERRKKALCREGIYVGKPLLAALSQALNDRQANPYYDMDFWSNAGDSVYRPHLTVRQLEKSRNFSYRRPYLVDSFLETVDGQVSVQARALDAGGTETFEARRLILAAGALGTARIALRSLGQYDVPVPLTCNAHTYVPCLHYRNLGQAPPDRCHSLAQLTMIYDPTGDRQHLVQGQLYSYRSLLLFRLLKELPLPQSESLRIMRELVPSMVIWVIQHEDQPSPDNHCVLRRSPDGSGDCLDIAWQESAAVKKSQRTSERAMMRAMRRVGCWPLRPVYPEHGSSVHYASTLPFGTADKPLTTEPSGRLRGTSAVYIADGAAFRYLPAKGLTVTLMANANRVGQQVVRSMN
jgi:choline dehydrogenase-like flavoprotein